jgi:hypothetical protein
VLILDMLIKYLPAITGLYLFVVQLRQSPRTRTRVWTAIGVAASAVGLTLIAALPWRDSPAVFQTIVNATAGGQRYADSLVDIPTFPIVARFLDRLSEHIPESVAAVRFWQQVIVRTLFVIYVAWETARLWQTKLESHSQLLRGAMGAALRTTLIVVIFVLTQTLDYYFISPLALAAVLGWRSTWTRVGFAISVLYLPTFYARREDLEPVPNLFLIIALGLPMVIGLISSFSGHLHAFTVRRTADA